MRFKIIILISLMLATVGYCQDFDVSLVKLGAKGESQICPILYQDGIVFMSNKKSQIAKTLRDETGHFPYNLYYRQMDGKKAAGEDKVFASSLKTEFNDGPVCFNKKEDQVFYSRNIDIELRGDSGRTRTLGIFMAKELSEGEWTPPDAFQFNNDGYNVSHPAINDNGDVLVFSSKAPGGLGGADLYIAYLVNGAWSKPKNLGPKINSSGNEMFPSFHNEKWLLFSSDGKGGEGGLDIFITKVEADGTFGESRLLGTGVNSKSDDFGITMRSDGMSGYFSSNRTGKDEIFYFEKQMPKFEACSYDEHINYCYTIQENNIVDDGSLPLKFVWDLGDGTKKEGSKVFHCYKETGNYLAKLTIIDTSTNELYYEVSQVAIGIQLDNRPYINGPDSVNVNTEASFTSNLRGLNPEAIEIYWKLDNGSWIMTDEISRQYNQIGVYEIKLGIVDSKGNPKCVTRKITVVDGGTKISTDPTVGNKGPNEISENERYAVELLNSFKKKALNDPIFEKVNYPITERFNQIDSVYQYTVGESDKVASLYQLYKEMKQVGFQSKVISFESDGVASPENEVIVFFGPGKDEISAYNLDNLKSFIKNVDLESKLEVAGFADKTGDTEFNKQLSLQRAKRVSKYFQDQGFNKENITIKALGAVASGDEADGLKFYRKVEVKLVDK